MALRWWGRSAISRVHAEKLDVAAVVLTGADAVELFIVQRYQTFPAFTVLENPVFKSIFYHPLLGLCFFGGRTIEFMLLLADFRHRLYRKFWWPAG